MFPPSTKIPSADMTIAHAVPAEALEGVHAGDKLGRLARISLYLGVAGLAMGAWLGWSGGETEMRHFWFSYLVGFTFLLTIGMGTLFFTMLQHAVGAYWSVVVRRIAELPMANFPLLAVMFLPLLVPLLDGSGSLWPWAGHHDGGDPGHTALLEHKRPFLNIPFFLLRVGIYFGVWVFLSRKFLRMSLDQDATDSPGPTVTARRWSAPSIIVFAFALSFGAFDLLMSLNPSWFSTIFGVYIFAGSFIANCAWLILCARWLQNRDLLTSQVTVEHYHDMGKFLFAFVFFWGYIGFSQFMLIWYANLPEETMWFKDRITPAWEGWSWFMVFGHFAIPFAAILSRHVKRSRIGLLVLASYALLMHWVDMYWVIMPNMNAPSLGGPADGGTNPFGLMEIVVTAGLVGLFVSALARRASKHPLLPVKDPLLGDSLAFENF